MSEKKNKTKNEKIRIIILGAPGVGKGTQAIKLSNVFNIPHLSTGDMLRKAKEDGTEYGKVAQEYMNKGQLVPDNLIISITTERIKRKDCEDGYILDGFPRTIVQAEEMERNGIHVDKVINIEVFEEEIIMRLSGRRTCSKCNRMYHIKFEPPRVDNLCDLCKIELAQRADDNENTIRERLTVYKNNTEPLIKYFEQKGILRNVDGVGDINEVFENIKQAINIDG